jgi:SAM-dependent methyltransferase
MTTPAKKDDPWERYYSAGRGQLYPWDSVVAFVFRNAARDRPRSDVRILEVGCGSGSNLWFAAREGFSVAGIDRSASAIAAARQRFEVDRLAGDLRVGSFLELPFPDATFDLAIDRGAITCVGLTDGRRAIAEINRVVRSGGVFLFTPFAWNHFYADSGTRDTDGLVHGISRGDVVGLGPICFYRREDIEDALQPGWSIRSLIHIEQRDYAANPHDIDAEWRVIATRK